MAQVLDGQAEDAEARNAEVRTLGIVQMICVVIGMVMAVLAAGVLIIFGGAALLGPWHGSESRKWVGGLVACLVIVIVLSVAAVELLSYAGRL